MPPINAWRRSTTINKIKSRANAATPARRLSGKRGLLYIVQNPALYARPSPRDHTQSRDERKPLLSPPFLRRGRCPHRPTNKRSRLRRAKVFSSEVIPHVRGKCRRADKKGPSSREKGAERSEADEVSENNQQFAIRGGFYVTRNH